MDPPFGSNIFYADSSLLWDAWLGAETDQADEIVVNQKRPRASGGKDLDLYGGTMAKAFSEASRVMRRSGRGVLAFSNTSDRVWMEVQDALSDAGLETNSVHVLDKGQPSIKGVKQKLGKEQVTRLDLTLTLAHRTRPARKREAAPLSFIDASIQRALMDGASDADHLYTAVLRDVLQADLSASGITMQSVPSAGRNLGPSCLRRQCRMWLQVIWRPSISPPATMMQVSNVIDERMVPGPGTPRSTMPTAITPRFRRKPSFRSSSILVVPATSSWILSVDPA